MSNGVLEFVSFQRVTIKCKADEKTIKNMTAMES